MALICAVALKHYQTWGGEPAAPQPHAALLLISHETNLANTKNSYKLNNFKKNQDIAVFTGPTVDDCLHVAGEK